VLAAHFLPVPPPWTQSSTYQVSAWNARLKWLGYDALYGKDDRRLINCTNFSAPLWSLRRIAAKRLKITAQRRRGSAVSLVSGNGRSAKPCVSPWPHDRAAARRAFWCSQIFELIRPAASSKLQVVRAPRPTKACSLPVGLVTTCSPNWRPLHRGGALRQNRLWPYLPALFFDKRSPGCSTRDRNSG
jgi:hypothetical protein